MKYAVKIPFGNPEDESSWIYVTEPVVDGDYGDLHPTLYDTYEQAETHGKEWRLYRVVEYNTEEA